jgi:hypothetical protein
LSCPAFPPFPITAGWPATYPDRLQLYSLPTPNGVKVSIMLEEIGLRGLACPAVQRGLQIPKRP